MNRLEEEKKTYFVARMNSLLGLPCDLGFLRETPALLKWHHCGYTTTYSQFHSNWGQTYCYCIRYSTSHPTHRMSIYTLFIIFWYGNILPILLQSILCTLLISLLHYSLTHRGLHFYIIILWVWFNLIKVHK